MHDHCHGLNANENYPHKALMYEWLVCCWWYCLESVRKCDVAGDMSLEAVFEVSNDSNYSQCASLPFALGSRYERSAVPVTNI